MSRHYVFLNDTGFSNHQGCRLVSTIIRKKLAERGYDPLVACEPGADWKIRPSVLKAMSAADFVLINGEGTPHHGSVEARKLIEIVDHPGVDGRIPIFLINSLWQENPVEWHAQLEKMSRIYVRDARSQRELNKFGIEARLLHDLSLSWQPLNQSPQGRAGMIVWGDSVLKSVKRELFGLSKRRGETFLDIHTTCKRRTIGTSSLTDRLTNLRFLVASNARRLVAGNINMQRGANGFVEVLRRHGNHVTGRFHGMCLAIASGTAFVGVTSNSWKMEQLVAEIGLDGGRIVQVDQIDKMLPDLPWKFSKVEESRRRDFLQHHRRATELMFDDLIQYVGT